VRAALIATFLAACSITIACEGVVGLGGLTGLAAGASVTGAQEAGGTDATDDSDLDVACGDNGAPCGADHVCHDGSCVRCAAGGPCFPGGNECERGVYDCSSGELRCVWSADVDGGAACDGGTCCNGSCVDTTSDDKACGPSCRACPSEARCRSSQCLVRVGHPTAFPGCPGPIINANILFAQKLTVGAPITAIALGAIVTPRTSSVSGVMALYTDSLGVPDTLMAYTAEQTFILDAVNEFDLSAHPTLKPGTTYWIAGEFPVFANICSNGMADNPSAYRGLLFSDPPPKSFGTASQAPLATINFYVVGTE
jgi:hypothetical protein